MPELKLTDLIYKKKWLNDHGNLACYPSYGINIQATVIWTSKTGVLSMTEEGGDIQDAVDHLFKNVKNKLWRMTKIVGNRVA